MTESRHFTYKYSNDLPIYTSEKFIKLFSFYLFIYSIPKNKASQTAAAEHWSQAVENGMMSAVLCKCDAENSIISHTNRVGKTLGGIRLFCSFEQTKQLTPIQNKKKSSSIHPHPNTNTHTHTQSHPFLLETQIINNKTMNYHDEDNFKDEHANGGNGE